MASGIVEQPSQGSGESKGSGQAQGQRSKLVQRLLAGTPNLPEFVNDLITAQAVSVAGTEAIGFMLERQGEEAIMKLIAHVRPDGAAEDVRQQAVQAFSELIRPCVEQQKDGALQVAEVAGGGGEAQFCLVTLLRAENNVVGVSAVITRCLDQDRAKQRLIQMQLVAGYFELYSLKRNAEQSKSIAVSHQHVLQAATAVSTAEGFENAARGLCNELATRTHAARVSIGWRKGNNIRLKAISHTEKFDKKQEMVTQLERVMEECADQEAPVHFDPQGGGTDNVTREAAAFSRANGGNSVIAMPLRKLGEVEGVLVVELLPQQKLDQNAAQGLMIAAELLAPQLYDRYENDRWLITKAGLSIRHVAEETIGPRFMLAKVLTAVGIVLLLVLFNWIPFVNTGWMYKVKARFQFVADERQIVSAPIDGAHIAKVYKRPGDDVQAGELLMEFDSTELLARRALAQADLAKSEAEWRRNRSQPDKQAEANIAQAEMEKAAAQVALLNKEIEKTKVTSRVTGKVLTGDWWQKVQTPVKLGEELFTVAGKGPLRAELQVADRDIQDVHVGQTGSLAITALPSDTYDFKISSIVPNGEPVEGENVFKVYAEITDAKGQDPRWLPGVAGEARVYVRERSIAWVWTHKLVEWVKMKIWLWT